MRSALLILATLVLLIGGFVVYTVVQPSRPSRSIRGTSVPTPSSVQPATAPANPSLPIGSGENAFIERYDAETGLLASRFRAARYDPQPDGTVNVDKPEAEFYLSSRQRDEKGAPIRQLLRLRGDRGEVVVPASGSTGTQAVGGAQMPTRGKLHNVTLMLFQNARAPKPTLICRVDNLAFDNDTFRIATEAFTDARGKLVDADQVPISVRGADYDFDGRGLTILWDERDRRLQLLEVAHGQVLTVKKPGAFGAPSADGATPRADATPSTRPTSRRTQRAASSGGVTTTNPVTPATTQATTAPTTLPAHEPIPYRATFAENVVITQDNVQIASADILNLDFLNEENGDKSEDQARSPDASASADADAAPSTTRPTTRKATASNRAAPSTATTTPAAPDAPPIVVRWTGKLTVTAAPTETPLPAPGDTVFELVSISPKPVLLDWQGSRIVCDSLRYHSLDDSAAIRSGDATPLVHVTDARGMALQTPKFDYDGTSRVAVLRGASHADLPIASSDAQVAGAPTTRPAQFARVDWSDRCTLHLAASPGSADKRGMTIESADVLGDVRVKSPQMDLSSNRLELTFDSSHATSSDAANPDIREMIATGSVRGVVHDPDPATRADAKPQSIDSERLNILFGRTSTDANGRSYPQRMIADGAVRTTDGANELRADHLEARFAPSTQPAAGASTQPAGAIDMPSIQIVELDATGEVRARSANGEFAEADQLRLIQVRGKPSYTLTGPSAKPARVGNDKSAMTGPIINIEPETGKASVVGPGALHAVQQQSAGGSTRPIDVTWSRGLDADESNNRIDITGDVVASSVLDDGSTNVAHSASMTMTLADAPPTTRPTTKPATTRPAKSSGGFAGALSGAGSATHDKIVRSVTLVDPKSVEVESTFTSANKTPLRRIYLSAPTLRYELEDKRLVVPVAGRMLYEDQRPAATTQPSTTPAAAANTSSPLGDSRGKTAFQWNKDFTYSDAEHRATMTGNVTVVHQSPAGEEEYRLVADRMSAEMEPDAAPATSNAAAAPKSDPNQAKLKRLTADGGVMLTSKKLQFNASHVEYDAAKNQLIARSSPGAPATLYDQNGLSEGTFDELYHDTITGRTQMVNFRGAVRK